MSSYECGANVSFDLCNDPSGTSTVGSGFTGAGHYHAAHVGHNDTLDRVFMRSYDAAIQGAIVAFKDSETRGISGRFEANPDANEPAWYNNDGMHTRNIGNDEISSVLIPQGYSVLYYADDGFSGDTSVMNGPLWKSHDFLMACQNLPSGWKDRLSSLKVFRTFGGNPAVGKWSSITTTESVDFHLPRWLLDDRERGASDD